MRLRRILLCTLFSIAVYHALSVVWGSTGVFQYERLQAYRLELNQNMRELHHRGEILEAELQQLGDNPGRLALEARSLLYYREGEQVVSFAGRIPVEPPQSPGKILRRNQGEPEQAEPILRTIAIGSGLVLLVRRSRKKDQQLG